MPASPPPSLLDRPAGVERGALRVLGSLRRIVRRIELCSAELEAEHGVTQPQLVCLGAIVVAGSITQADLARTLHLSASTLVGVIDRLEQKGLVQRTRDAADRRRVFLSATVAGRAKAESAPEPLHQRVRRALAGLPAEELAYLDQALMRLVDLLDAGGLEAAPLVASGAIPKPADQEARPRASP